MVGQHSAMISILLVYLTLYQSRLQNLNNKDNMKHINKIFLILLAGLLVAQCSTYSMKSDMTKNGVINKTPKWYVKYPHTTKKHYQEAASAVSPDLELAVNDLVDGQTHLLPDALELWGNSEEVSLSCPNVRPQVLP